MQNTETIANQTHSTPAPQPTNTPPTTQIPIQTPTPKNKKPWLLIALVVLLFGATGAFAYKYYELKQQLDSQPSSSPTSLPSPQLDDDLKDPTVYPSPIVDQNTNLNIYYNNEYNYSMKYPKDWVLLEINDSKIFPNRILKHITFKPSLNKDYSLNFGIAHLDEKNVQLTSRTGTGDGDLISGTPLTLGKYQIPIKYLVWENQVDDVFSDVYIEINDEYVVYVDFTYFPENPDDKAETDLVKTQEFETAKQILSTFEFRD